MERYFECAISFDGDRAQKHRRLPLLAQFERYDLVGFEIASLYLDRPIRVRMPGYGDLRAAVCRCYVREQSQRGEDGDGRERSHLYNPSGRVGRETR